MINQLSSFEGLIIDDLGYVRQCREEIEVLFTLLAETRERGSVVLMSNLPFSKWDRILKDAMSTATAIDRLVHHCVIIELHVPSFRVETAKRIKIKTLLWADSRIVGNRIGLPGPGHGRVMSKAPTGNVVNDVHVGESLSSCPNGATCESLGQRPRSSNRNRRSPNGAICDRIHVAPLGNAVKYFENGKNWGFTNWRNMK